MAVLYKTAQSILANKDGKKLFYPRVVLKGNVSTDQIAQEIAEYSSLSKGDTKNVIDNLVRVLTTHLQSSESVTLDGFGTFRMTMKSNGKGFDPRKLLAPGAEAIKATVKEKMELFGSVGKAND